MSALEAVSAVAAPGGNPLLTSIGLGPPAAAGAAPQAGFASILAEGMRAVDSKLATANDLVRRFALDDSVPLHQVTFALEEARISVELAMQVRARLVEGYRELMNMQL